MADSDLINVEGAPQSCSTCGAPLCLRKQVINLSFGNTDSMRCLVCLGKEMGEGPERVLSNTTGYILSRDCFRKEWVRYETVAFCPDQEGCFPALCFGEKKDNG